MTVNAFLSPNAKSKFWANIGTPLAFGKLYTYAAGTVIPAATYVDSTATTQNTNPIILDFRGEASIWLPPNIAFKFLLTDSAGNIIPGWPVDQILISQLLTLYGGVDIGNTNAYVINYAANFTTITDGIVIYWFAGNTNTGPSTLNVNGLGVLPIVQQNGNPLTAGQILVNTVIQVMSINGQWVLLSSANSIAQTGTFQMTPGGFVAPPNTTVTYSITGNICTLTLPFFFGTSNAVTLTYSGLPAGLVPITTQQYSVQYATDNGSALPLGQAQATFTSGSSIITFSPSIALGPNGWTPTGQKQLGFLNPPHGSAGNTLSYSLV